LVECFQPYFRLKVIDSSVYYATGSQGVQVAAMNRIKRRQTRISFIRTSEELYKSFEEGQRYRLFNLKPESNPCGPKNKAVGPNPDCLFLQFQPRGKSKRENFVEMVRDQLQVTSASSIRKDLQILTEFTRKQVETPIQPMQLMERVSELAKAFD